MHIEDLADSFKSLPDLQNFAIAQQKTLTDLQRKMSLLEEENAHLKILLESKVPLIGEEANNFILSDEETIARLQLKKIKETAIARELSLDEAKRVKIFTDIIHMQKSNGKEDKALKEIRQTDDTALLEMLDPPNEK